MYYSYVDYGVITRIKPVHISEENNDDVLKNRFYIQDTQKGVIGGATVGAIIGSVAAKKNPIGGAIIGAGTGAAIGYLLSKGYNGQELYIKLDTGDTLVTDIKGKDFNVGDRVEIVHTKDKIIRISKID